MHPSVIAGAMPAPLTGEPLGGCRLQSLPCKGLRSRAPPAAEKAVSHAANGRHSFYYRLFGDRKHRIALRSPLRSLPLRGNAAVAERKCASAHAARCGHRKPDGGCAARRRRRGALPVCGGDILKSPAGPCPASVGDDLHAKGRYFVLCALKRRLRAAMLASSRNLCNAANPMRRAKSPALQCRRERAATHKRQPSARPAGGPMKSSAPTQGAERPVGAGSCPTPGHRLPSPVPPPVCLAL